jgi:hypothetical protein
VKIAESGNERQQSFCPKCGTPIFSASPHDDPNKVHSLRVGSVRQRDRLIPKQQSWMRSSQRWLDEMDALPQSERG